MDDGRARRRQRPARSRGGAALLVLLLATSGAADALARPGELDPRFGFLGFVLQPREQWTPGFRAVALQGDGKVLAAGEAGLTRYLQDGRVDTSFGVAGTVDGTDAAVDVAVQPDGRILLLRWALDGGGFALLRYRADGAPDASFGEGGRAQAPLLPVSESCGFARSSWSEPAALALQRGGKVLVAGTLATRTTGPRNSWTCDQDIVVFRFSADGTPDTAFGEGGVATVDFGERWGMARDVALQFGRIVVAGSSCAMEGRNGGMHTFMTRCAPERTPVLLRLTSSGDLDAGFGNERVDLAGGQAALELLSVAVLADGAVVTLASGSDEWFAARWSARGDLDTRFGEAGRAGSWLPTFRPGALAVDRRGRVVVAGSHDGFSLGVLRLQRDGAADGGFGFHGIVATVLGDHASAVALQPSGAIVVAGADDAGDVLVRLLGGH